MRHKRNGPTKSTAFPALLLGYLGCTRITVTENRKRKELLGATAINREISAVHIPAEKVVTDHQLVLMLAGELTAHWPPILFTKLLPVQNLRKTGRSQGEVHAKNSFLTVSFQRRYPGRPYGVFPMKERTPPWMSLSHQQPEPRVLVLIEQHCI